MKKAQEIIMEGIESSQISKVGYSSGVLLIEFIGGSKYIYVGVDRYTYNALMSSESKGSFFSKNIKNDEDIVCIKI
jgi:hypothetical protein